MKSIKFSWLILTSLYLILIYYLSTKTPKTSTGSADTVAIKQLIHNLMHLPAYSVMCWLWYQTLNPKQFVWPIILSISYGCLMEYAQTFVPGRSAEWLDVFVNTSGVLLAILIIKKHKHSS